MILLTGATGYIGSHLWVELLQGLYEVVGVDNLSNSNIEVCRAVEKIAGKKTNFIKGDIRDAGFLSQIFSKYSITQVIHLAALKDVQESSINKDEYFEVNVNGLKTLLSVMRAHNCLKIIFSSSAAVYGDKALSPISEHTETAPSNWYGETKLLGEQLLSNEILKTPPIDSASLRYFNVAGKHASGLLTNNCILGSHSLFDQIANALRSGESLRVFGDDWDTDDGTCVRDYIHVNDIVRGHIDAMRILDGGKGFTVLNLGSGKGESVKRVIAAFEGLIGRPVPIKIVGKRAGDVPISYADCSRAKELMNWTPLHSLSEICSDQIKMS
jgi:UDP-glucose 4-epimerase